MSEERGISIGLDLKAGPNRVSGAELIAPPLTAYVSLDPDKGIDIHHDDYAHVIVNVDGDGVTLDYDGLLYPIFRWPWKEGAAAKMSAHGHGEE